MITVTISVGSFFAGMIAGTLIALFAYKIGEK